MKFIDSYRFSPVVNEKDKPWSDDYFHVSPEAINNDFLKKGLYDIDDEWWFKQRTRCRYGFTVPNAIDFGGDAIVDEVDCFWNDSKEHERYIKDWDIFVPPNSCCIPQYNITIKNREVWITNRHYFYLNFWKIYGIPQDALDRYNQGLIEVIAKENVNPKFLDMDYLFYMRLKMMFEQRKDGSELKARQKGFSEKLSGGIAAYNYLFMPASLTIIAGGQSDDADKTYLASKRGLENLKNTQFYKEYENSNLEYTHSANTGSEIRTVSCKDNTQALNRFSPFFTILEEGGKWKKDSLVETQEFAEAATKAEGIKTGYKIYVATGGNMDLGAADMEIIHYNPDQFNCLKFRNRFEEEGACNGYTGHFTPSWMYRIIDKDGNSLKKESLVDIYKEESTKKSDKKVTFWTQNPIFASQAFMIPTGGFFGERIINALNIRRAFIRTHTEDQLEIRGRLEWKNPKKPFDGVEFIRDPKGHVILLEEPQKDKHGYVLKNLYKLGTDSYDKDEALTSTSMGSVSVFKGFYDANSTYKKYCMRITERPGISEGGKDIFYEDTAKACIYYGGINLIEWSNILIFEWYEKNGFASLLKERPDLAMASSVKKSKVFNKWGVDPNTKIHWLTKLRKYLEDLENIDKLDDTEQIAAFAKFRYNPGKKYNCDITIASALCIVCYEDEMMYEVQTSEDYKDTEDKPVRYAEINGQIVMV